MTDDEKKPGRKPLNLQKIEVRLAPDVVKRIDAITGQHKRPAFIREAVSRELSRRERKG